jgi:hypothetical protein
MKSPIHEHLTHIETQLTSLQSLHPSNKNHAHEKNLTFQHHDLLQKQVE